MLLIKKWTNFKFKRKKKKNLKIKSIKISWNKRFRIQVKTRLPKQLEKGGADFQYQLFSIYLKMVGHTVVREDATKDVTIVTVVPNTIFTSFDILRDLPRNGYLTRAENHRHPLPLEPISTWTKRRENIVIICLSDGWPDIVSRSIPLFPPFPFLFAIENFLTSRLFYHCSLFIL